MGNHGGLPLQIQLTLGQKPWALTTPDGATSRSPQYPGQGIHWPLLKNGAGGLDAGVHFMKGV